MAGDKFDQLYNALKADGAVSGTREHFRQFVYAPGKQGYHNRKQLYDALHADGAVSSKSYEEFAQRLGLHAVNPKPQQQKPVQPVKKLTMKQRAQEVAAQYQKSRQQKAQQPRTATTSGTDYMQNWQLMHMRNDQMNPMQQAQASNARARMQRAQEQAARQEQQRATPISRSRITPTAKNFNETMQQLSTPEARQARGKQQRIDDARAFAQYEVEGNKFVRNDGQTEGILGNDLLKLVDSSMNEAQELTRQQYQQNLDKMGGIYAPQSVKEQAFRDAQTQEQVNRQNVLMNNLSKKIGEIYSQKGMQRHIAESAERLNMGVEEYVDKYVTPEIMNYAQKALTMRNQEEIMPHGALDYIAKNLSNSIIGMVLAPSVMSRDTRQRLQEGIAIADGDAEIQKVAGHKDETYRSGIGTRFASTAVNMAADSGPLAVIGAGASAAVNAGTRVLTNGLVKAGMMKAAQRLTAQQMAFKVANMTTAQKIMSGLGTRTATSSLNLAGYSGVTAALSQASTGDDTSLQAIGEAGLKGAGHGAVTGAMFGVSGAVMAPWVSKFGITGLEKSTGERLLHGAQKFGATAAGLGVEAGTMMVADNVTGDKDISFGTWLEDVVMVGAFKAGEPSNFVKMGNILHHLTHNSGGNFVIGKNANGSPIAVDIRLTPDEKNELISSASGKNLMDAFVKVDRASKTAPRDPKYKTAYTDFMNDPDVSQSTKEKVNAAMGLFNTTRGRSYRSVNDVKNKQVLEYTKNGTLLTRTSYKNADERRAILYKQKLYRDNDDMMSLMGYARMKDMQFIDDDGTVTNLAFRFLKENGYDENKDITDPNNARLINELRNQKSALYLDWEKYADKNGLLGYLRSESKGYTNNFMASIKELLGKEGSIVIDIDKIMRKDPMKRTDEENRIFYHVKRALEDELFPSWRPHADQSASQGKTVAEEHSLGTDNPEGGVVVDELRNLHNAEQAVDEAMESNDVFKQTFEKLHQQGLTPAQIYDALIQNGLTQEELTPLAQYINANARVQGMQQATADAIEENVKSFVSDWSYHGTLNGQPMNGEQALYVQDSNGRTLLVGSGDVAFDQTTGKAKEGSGDMLVCFDPNTKEMVYVKADEVTLFQNQPIDQFEAEYRQRLQMKNSEPYNQAAQEQAMQDAAKAQQEQEAPQDNTTKSEDSTTKEGDLTKDNTTLTKVDTTSGKDNTTNEDLVQQEQPQPSRKFADGSDVPMATDSKGRPTPDYEKMTPEQSAEILAEDFGENAEKVVDGQIQKAEKALKDAEKMKVDYTAEPNDIMEQEALKSQTIEAAKQQLDHAQNIKKAMTAKKVAETVGKTEQTEGAHEAGSVAAQKFVNAPRLVGNKRTRMLPDGETKIKGHYEIVPAESLTPSHDVNNGYKKSEGFPTDAEGRTVNDRDYEHDKAAQQNTDQIARKYNGMAIEQVPVVSDEGIVYDGNGRTMAGQKAAKDGTDGEYINDLLENAENFGFTREQIEQSGIEHPRLVLVTDERLPYDTATFSKFNRNEKKTQSNTEQAVAKAKTLTSDEVGAIVAEIEGNGSLDAFFNNSKAINDLVKTLVDKGIIGQNEVAQMMDSPERLSAQGREYVKNLLLGSIFKPETIRMLGIDSTVKNKAINAIRSVMDNMKLGEFSLRDEIDQAIQLLYEARQGGNKVDTLLRTSEMFGEDAAKRYSSISQMMALALEGKVADFRDLLDEYNRIAASRNTGEGSIFEAAPTKEELVNEYLNFKKWQDYGTGRSENEGGNDVSGVEEPQQEASGGNEPAEAERPRVEEADDLENKELESRIEVTDEETETPSKNGPIMKQKILIDGDKEVMKVDEPNKKGEYTGSYYEYDGKKFGDLNEVTEYIDSKNEEGPLPLLPKEENPDPQFNPIEAAAAEFKKEHPLTEDEIMKADVDDLSKDMALDYLNGEVTDDLHRAIYESIYAKRKGLKAEPKVETPKAEPSADPMEGIKNAAEGFEKEKKAKAETEKKPQQAADDAAVAASSKKVNDLWNMLKNAGKDEISASFIGLNSRQLEVLPKLVSAMAENAYLRIKRGMHNLEDVVKEMRKEFAPAAKVFKKEDVDAIYEQMMNIRYRDGEQRMSLKEWADYYEKTSPKHQENLVGDSKTAEDRKLAEKKFIDTVNIKLGFKHKFNGIVELRQIAEKVGLKDIKDTDLQELAETAIVKRARGIASSESTNDAVKFERIKTLYENQPSLNQRDSERVMKQQYSTPAPYAFLADMYVKGNGKVIESALEPSAGNGMLTIGLPMDKVHVNDIDAQRLANLRRQGFKNVTSQDGTQPFADKNIDVVVTNPPFGSATPKEYDGYKISSLEGQMAINALESMKDDGRAAIIIGGKTEYAKNGSLNPKDKAFLGYLYSHYNVEDVINVDGGLYAKQGTSYPTRIILINGRRLNENAFPPVKDKARAETVKDYDELYKRIEDDILRGERMDSSIGGETRSTQSELDQQGSAGTSKEGVRTGERGGSEPDGKRGSDVSDTSSVSGTHDDLENQRGTEPREDGRLSDGDTGADGTRAEPSQSEGTTSETNGQRGAGSGGAGRNDTQPSTDESASTGSGSGPRGQLQRVDKSVRGLSTEKVTYTPKSGNPFTLKAVMPADQQEAVNKNLEKLGDADQFLVDELGYNDKDDLYSHLAAEQVDSVALALQQAKKGNAFIIGDMTGIGKGRQAASLIRYAKKQGQVPVYFTKTAGLLSDVYRDLVDIGSPELRPFVFGSAKEAAITDSDGNVVFALPSKSEVKRVLDYIEKNGKLPEEYDYVLTTYSQVSNGVYEFDENGARKEKKLAKGKTFGAAALSGQRRRDAIEKLMDNAYLILDESHTAGGNSGQGNYFQHIIQKAKNVTFFSATFAKRPDNMPIYALRTAMNEGGMKASDLIDAVKRGGATLQEIMSQTLTQCGQMIRRERDMTGVTIDWKAIDDPERVQEQREQYDSIIGLFNDIINFQKKYVSGYVDKRNEELAEIQSTIGIKKGTAALGIKNQPFASKAFNTVQQVLLSLKAKSAAERAIDYLKQGMKPVIALNNTNESQTGNLALGEEMDAPDLGTSLKKGLEGTLRYTQKDAKDNSESGYIKLSDLGEEAVEAYHELEKKIEQTSTGLSLSPIDVIKNELQKAGYKVGELTGRQTEFVYNENGTVTKIKRADTDKKKLARDFNDGKIDALILNKSAATGISLHASSKYKDQKKRVMIVAQQQLDVNDEVQMRGRIDRTGQVARGAYEYVVSLIPAEQRLLMMFKAKLKSLDANTTSSQKSKFNEMEVADITNKYGDKVVREYMAEHLDLYSRMADPFGWEKSLGEDLSRIDPQRLVADGGGVGDGEAGADASKLLGRMALLRVNEQEKMLQEIGELYANEIQRLNEMGENDLEITELPLKAKTIRKEVWKQGAEPGGDNAFADNTYIEKVNMAILKKPMKASEVKASQEGLTGGKTWEEYKTEKKTAVKEYFDQKIADEAQRYEERAVKVATKAKEKYIKDAKKGQKDSGMSDEQIEKMAGYQYDNIYKQEKDKLNDVVKNLKAKAEMFDRVLDTFDTNSAFVLPADMNNPNELSGFGNSYGRLIDIKITDNFSPNASSVSFATLDGRRKITFPIAGKVGVGDNKADVISAIDNMTKQAAGMGDSHLRVLNQKFDNWDRLTSNESRKNGYIVTGNLMQALVDSKDQGLGGQLVKYTTDTGEVKTGILMPDHFDPKGLTTDAPINSVADKFELSSWHGGIDEVTSSDGEVKVKRIDNNRGNYYELRVPKSKAKGGKYFLDKDLLKLVNGNNFETRGNNMLAEFKPEQLKPVLDRLSKMGVKVQEERKASEDEGTHFREDRGLQYSKTDTKDVKKGRIIPEDVDKTVSSQIEKRFDDEVERLYGDSPEKPNIEKEANKYAEIQYIDTFKYDEKGNPVKKYEGLNSIIDSLDSKLKDIEQKYGFNRKTDFNEIKRAIGTEAAEGNDSRGTDEVSQGVSVRISSGKGVLSDYQKTALSLAAAQRAKEYLLERFNNIRLKYGLEEGDWASKEQVERIFNDYNSDTDVKKIFDRIEGIVDVLGTKLKGEAYKKVYTEGYYYHPKNYILIDTDYLSSIQFSKQELASTICHEMLHVVTSDIINLYRKGYGDLLNERQRKAAKEVVDLYGKINSYFERHFDGAKPYALTNPAEMITELANPAWRRIAAQMPAAKGWFRSFIAAVRNMLGFPPKVSALDRLDKALENVIRNLDYGVFQKGAELNDEIVNKKVTDPEEQERLNKEKTFSYPTSSVESHVEKVAQKTGGKVKMVSSVDEITNKTAKDAIEEGRKITGWYDEKTGEVHLYMPNIHDKYTAEKTIWHEVVGHKGMRELFGDERFDKFLRDVWYDLDKPENAALKKLVDEERKYNPLNIYNAIEEGIARLAEDGKGEAGFWNGIKNKVSDFLHEIGYRIAPNTKDVKYLLWLSKNLQKNPNDPYWKMRAEAVKYRLDHERMPAVVAHDGMFYGNDGKVSSMENLTKSEWDEATDGQIHFRTTPSAGTALDRYHRSLDEHGYMFTESYMDSMLSLKKLMNAIVPDKKIEDIASSENPYILQNTMQGAMSDAAQMFERNVMKPLDKAMADVLDAFDGKKDDEKIRNFNLYMITKHGLERNREFFVRDFLKQMRMDEQKKQDADFLENSYYSDKEYLDNELKAGNIDLKEYYRQLDESIRNHFDADFEAGEHDYSGMHAIQEVAKSSDPYDDAEAIQSVMDSEAKMESIKKGTVKDYWNKVKAATQYSIDSDYKNGIISKELHGHVSNMFNWYVPLRKYDEATAEDTYGYITEQGDPKSYIGSTIMRARGHKYLSETNVLAQIGAMGNRAIKNGGMNAIRQAFARFARNNSGNNLITETSVWYEKDPVVNIVYERYPDIPEGATADEINQIVSDFNKDMKMKESQGLAYKVYRRDKIGYKFQRAENKSQHIVDVKIAGRTHTFIINGNPRAAQALNGLLENSGAKGIMKPLSSISRMMAQLCTSYNPEFVMRNIMRDAEFASSNVTSKEGARYGALWAKYYAQLGFYKGASTISFKDLSGTTGLGLFAKYRNGTLDTSDKVQRYFKEFMENGGETGWVQIKNMQDWTKEYKKDVKSERSKIDKGGAALRDFFFGNLANINEVAENIARFATYCASRDSNRSIIRSVYDAKEVSTNFNRHGSGDAIKSFKNGEMTGGKAAARWAYGFTASYLRHCSMFFNAGIQSTNLLVKNLKNHPVGTSINMLAIPFALGALAALGNNVLIASEDEKDRKGVKDPYGELPDYVRRNNLCIYKGGGEFVTIPLAIELRAFYGLGDLAAGLTFSPNVSGQKNPALDAVGCMSQLVPVMDYLGNSSAGKEPLNETIKAISPSALSPFVEWELNTDWKGAPIERRGDWNENSPAWQRAYKGTPDGYMAVNKWVNAQTNDVSKGNEDMLGNSFLDMVTNPSMLNHYIGGIGGGAATFTERAIGVIKHGSDTETKDIPFLRSLLYTPSEQSSLQRTKSKWYNYKDEMEKTMANVDRLKSKNVPLDKRITNIGEYYQFQNSKEAAKVRVIELAEKQMKRWKKMRDKASDTESINFANQNIDRIMMDAVDELDRLE
ncbi:hypothetical protein DW657_13360 [Prevotella sp. AM23-5]|uniref:strawberry notch C-terminal domain-containing protein n=1 Tax=Prevotellaceae TaxID=171552 RepID=UPI000E4E5334|nr:MULTISPECIES: strawberry notch C-terminal domain-containing protein [Prevotellaceae]RHN89485.1 hypothetical protein DW657_13360 [Prevotella sp. AM23-5]